jgi:PASTA domain
VSEFIEECRREWKRLRVPDPIADEMAADLAADLQEAEGEGVSPEEVLGSGASDPRAFAASWATERGVVQPRFRDKFRRRLVMLGAAALLAALAGAGLAVAIYTSSQQSHASTVTAPSPRATNAAVPDFVGFPIPLAVRQAEAAGLEVRIVLTKHAGLPAGTVLAQAPVAGEEVVRGSTLELWVTECSRSYKKPCEYR